MESNNIDVKIKHYTPLEIAVEAALTCTANENNAGNYNACDFITKLLKAGHESVIEHITYNIAISNISRAVLQELSRHRHISLSVQSTRWALKKIMSNDDIVISDMFDTVDNCFMDSENGKDLIKYYENIFGIIKYAAKNNVANDIIKYFLPEAIKTKLIMTINARELRHIFRLRSKAPALKEFQNLVYEIYKELPNEHKFMFDEFFENTLGKINYEKKG